MFKGLSEIFCVNIDTFEKYLRVKNRQKIADSCKNSFS